MDDDKFASMSREEKEAEVKRQREELRRLLAEHTDLIKTFALEKPELFIRFVCEYELGIGDVENNIFSRYDKSHRPIFQDIANAILRQLEKDDEGKTHDEQEYVLLADYAASYLRPYVSSRIFNTEHKDPSRLPYLFFESKSEEFGCGLSAASELAHHGLPLFYLQTDGTYQQLAFDHPDHIFVFMMKEQMGWIQTTDLPPWARKYYVKAEHIRTERLYFASDNLKPEDIPALRKSLRTHLGVDDASNSDDLALLRTKVAALEASQGKEKPLSTTSRNTLLTIIAALCDYSAINLNERGAASNIAKRTEEFGAPVSDDTVRRILELMPDALASRKK